jgi:hypothetical protein
MGCPRGNDTHGQYRASLFPMMVFLSSAGGLHYPDKEKK